MDTDMVTELGLEPRSSVMDGRDAVLKLVNDTDIGNGEYYNVQELAKAHAQAYDNSVRDKLWQVSKELISARVK